jgi:diguanylate cyclase (GGDEF)-like protein/PAS domain S-box-containing protein
MTPMTFAQTEVVSTAPPRQELLSLMGLADTSPEQEFDEIVELAATICGKPMGAMTLLTDTENYTKATVGLPAARLPLEESVCRYTVLQDDVMMVEDTHADHRFDEHGAMIHCPGGIRFYAGMPLTTADGTHVGALCVMDTTPSTLSPQQLRALEVLGRQISSRLQLRERVATVARMAQDLESGRTMFDTILNNVPVEIYLKDRNGRLQFYNRKLAERFSISTTEWLGKTSHELWDRETADKIVREEEFVLNSGRPHESFVEIPEPGGRISYWRSEKAPCRVVSGDPLLACCSVDVTGEREREIKLQQTREALEEANRKLNSLALTDSLTGLWNRRAFDAQLETSVSHSHRTSLPLAIMLLDVDNFKAVNDRYGHPYGDTVLRNVASVLARAKRTEDLASRFGGEEFAVVLPNTDVAGAQALAQRILQALRAFPWENEPVTASLGVAMCSLNTSSDDLIDLADNALYRAKNEGKDCVVCNGCA